MGKELVHSVRFLSGFVGSNYLSQKNQISEELNLGEGEGVLIQFCYTAEYGTGLCHNLLQCFYFLIRHAHTKASFNRIYYWKIYVTGKFLAALETLIVI